MALNKPIVTTGLPECMKYDSVMIGKDHDDFITKVDKAIQMKDDKSYTALFRQGSIRKYLES